MPAATAPLRRRRGQSHFRRPTPTNADQRFASVPGRCPVGAHENWDSPPRLTSPGGSGILTNNRPECPYRGEARHWPRVGVWNARSLTASESWSSTTYTGYSAMPSEMEQRYQQRLKRYVTAMRNEKPDRVPIRPFVAEFTAKYAGYTVQEVTQDYQKAFAAARKCAADFDWDAVVGNMVYVWGGLTQAIGLKYYAMPGRRGPARHGLSVPGAAGGRSLDAAG